MNIEILEEEREEREEREEEREEEEKNILFKMKSFIEIGWLDK